MTPAEEHPTQASQGDEEMLRLLADGFAQIEPVPASALEQAYGAHLLSDVEAELAQLVYDSSLAGEVAMRRGDESVSRFLSFANEFLTLDLSLMDDRQAMVGEIDPVIAEELTVESEGGGSISVPIDKFGRFRANHEAACFRIVIAGRLVTQWITR